MRRPTLSILAVAFSTACGPQETGEIPGPMGTNTRNQHDDPQLQSLNEELVSTSLRSALSQLSHFAPLCDEAGYPLVGNIVSKGGTTASEFCEQVRGLKK